MWISPNNVITYSIIQKSQLEGAKRLDAEYYQPEYLEMEQKIKKSSGYKLWHDIEGKFVTGPFGSEFNVENYILDGEYRYIRGKDVKDFFLENDDNVYIPKKDFERLKKYSLDSGDILISVVGTLGNTIVIDKNDLPAIFSCKSTVFRTKTVNPYYFLSYLSSKYGQSFLQRSVRGALQTGLNINDLRDLPIFIPNVDSQENIASIVQGAKKEFENSKSFYSQAEVFLLEELGLKDFRVDEDLFSVVNFSDIKLANRMDAEYYQPKYERLLKLLRQSKPLLEFAKRVTRRTEITPQGKYKYIEISDVNAGSGEVTNNSVLGKELPANAKIRIEGGELLVSKVRPTRGAVSIVPADWKKDFIASGAFSVFDAPSSVCEYLQVVLRSPVGKIQMERPTTGTSYPTITDADVENVRIPILSDAKQKKITGLVRESHMARRKAKELLEEAKRKVEELIENQA